MQTKRERQKMIKSLERNDLTAQQLAFCDFYASGLSPTEAAKEAGYSTPRDSSLANLQNPKVLNRVRELQLVRLNTEGCRIAVEVLVKLMQSAESEAVRFSACKWTLENGGLGLASRIADRQTASDNRGLSELSISELEDVVRRGKEAYKDLKQLTPIVTSTESNDQ